MLTSGHPPETRTRVLTYGHSPGSLKYDINLGLEGLQALADTAENGNRGEGFNDWGGWGYDGFVHGEVTKTDPSGDRTT